MRIPKNAVVPLAIALLCACLSYSSAMSAQRIHHISLRDNDKRQPWIVPVVPSADSVHIQILWSNHAIDLYSRDGNTFRGKLITHAFNFQDRKAKSGRIRYKERTQVYYQKDTLDNTACLKIARQLIGSGQPAIPTDSLIFPKNRTIHDCIEIKYVFKIGAAITTSRYYCPMGQPDTTPYIAIIRANYYLISDSLGLDKIFDSFIDKLPRGRGYRVGDGPMFISTPRMATKRESARWIKYAPLRAYLATVKDTVNNYLNNNFTKLLRADTAFTCSGNFELLFSKEGRLVKVRPPQHDYKLDKEDRKEENTCLAIIQSIFSKANLSFIKPPYGYSKTLKYGEEDWEITD